MDIETIDQILSTARSVRRRLDFDREVPLDVIEACINIAIQAPTGLGGENWRFIVVRDAGLKKSLAGIYADVLLELTRQRGVEVKPAQQVLVDRLHEIPCMILVCAIGEPGHTSAQQVAFYGSILPAAWSLMLALRARHIGTTWTTLLSSRSQEVSRLLGIPADVTQTVMLPVAYSKNAVMKLADRAPACDVTYLDHWEDRAFS